CNHTTYRKKQLMVAACFYYQSCAAGGVRAIRKSSDVAPSIKWYGYWLQIFFEMDLHNKNK
ncbi:MAG: hypothetical protein KAH86_02265, partial [Methanosarcinales archaeon]|nr:hypothetical protein [Methanosarcinales archaeon]